jgi:hypothetical protein
MAVVVVSAALFFVLAFLLAPKPTSTSQPNSQELVKWGLAGFIAVLALLISLRPVWLTHHLSALQAAKLARLQAINKVEDLLVIPDGFDAYLRFLTKEFSSEGISLSHPASLPCYLTLHYSFVIVGSISIVIRVTFYDIEGLLFWQRTTAFRNGPPAISSTSCRVIGSNGAIATAPPPPTPAELAGEATSIFASYLEPGAPWEVNVAASVRHSIERGIYQFRVHHGLPLPLEPPMSPSIHADDAADASTPGNDSALSSAIPRHSLGLAQIWQQQQQLQQQNEQHEGMTPTLVTGGSQSSTPLFGALSNININTNKSHAMGHVHATTNDEINNTPAAMFRRYGSNEAPFPVGGDDEAVAALSDHDGRGGGQPCGDTGATVQPGILTEVAAGHVAVSSSIGLSSHARHASGPHITHIPANHHHTHSSHSDLENNGMVIRSVDSDGLMTIHVAASSSSSSTSTMPLHTSGGNGQVGRLMSNNNNGMVAATSTTAPKNGLIRHVSSESKYVLNESPTTSNVVAYQSATTLVNVDSPTLDAITTTTGTTTNILRTNSPTPLGNVPLTVVITPPSPVPGSGEPYQAPFYPTLTVTVHDVDSGMQITSGPPIGGSMDSTFVSTGAQSYIYNGIATSLGGSTTGPYATHPNHHHYYQSSNNNATNNIMTTNTMNGGISGDGSDNGYGSSGTRRGSVNNTMNINNDPFFDFRHIFDEARAVVVGMITITHIHMLTILFI